MGDRTRAELTVPQAQEASITPMMIIVIMLVILVIPKLGFLYDSPNPLALTQDTALWYPAQTHAASRNNNNNTL